MRVRSIARSGTITNPVCVYKNHGIWIIKTVYISDNIAEFGTLPISIESMEETLLP